MWRLAHSCLRQCRRIRGVDGFGGDRRLGLIKGVGGWGIGKAKGGLRGDFLGTLTTCAEGGLDGSRYRLMRRTTLSRPDFGRWRRGVFRP